MLEAKLDGRGARHCHAKLAPGMLASLLWKAGGRPSRNECIRQAYNSLVERARKPQGVTVARARVQPQSSGHLEKQTKATDLLNTGTVTYVPAQPPSRFTLARLQTVATSEATTSNSYCRT
jgi:hypothetical protein